MEEAPQRKKALSMGMTAFFLIAQMAGAGFLALPRALANTGERREGVREWREGKVCLDVVVVVVSEWEVVVVVEVVVGKVLMLCFEVLVLFSGLITFVGNPGSLRSP